MIKYKKEAILDYSGLKSKLYPGIKIKEITFQVTEDCCLNCSYCYQTNKSHKKMDFKIAKIFIDQLLSNQIQYFTTNDMGGIIISFIGGEPLLEIKLINEIWEYFIGQLIKLNHPWKKHFRGCICSNGIPYFNTDVQEFLQKYSDLISFTISLDGNKELHDSCRVDFNGLGSYDKAISAIHHYRKHYGDYLGTKMTLSPYNITYLYDAVLNLINEQYTDIHLNCVYEEGWTIDHAKIMYQELIKLADYIIDNNLNEQIYISIFDEKIGQPMEITDNENWCGGVDQKMLAIDPDGNYFTCIRYMDSSLNGEQKNLKLGQVEQGFLNTDQCVKNHNILSNITRRSQSTDECFYCPIAQGCAWCSAYNYQKTGTPNKRVTYICIMHKARTLANIYYWNKIYKKYNISKEIKDFVSDKDKYLLLN